MPTSANEALFDAMVRHQIYVMRYSGAVRNRIHKILNDTEADLAKEIRDRLRNAKGDLEGTKRLEFLLRFIRNTRTKAWEEVNAAWAEELVELSKQEPVLMQQMVTTTSPVVVETALPPPRQLRAIALSRPFQGRVLRDWAGSIKRDDLARIENAVRMGLIEGENSAQIARRVVGTARLRGVDGVTEITRRNATAITRTAVNHVANFSRREFFQENSDILKEERYVATLDARTTAVCRANDGKRFPVARGPHPPLHWNCRSTRVPVFDGDELAKRPAKPVTEKMLLREYSKRAKLQKTPRTRGDVPHGHKTAFDEFKQQRVRELTGRVPGETSYQNWLTRQSREFQDDVLGKTKGQLFRDGKLKLDKFINRNGDELTLSQLAKREAQAFRAAGLDPEDFR